MVRLITGVLLAVVFFALIWFTNATVLLIVALVIAALAVHEYLQLFRALGAHVPAFPTLITAVAVVVVVPFPHVALGVVLAIGLLVIAIWTMATLEPITASASSESGAVDAGFSGAALGAAAGVLAPIYIGLGLGTLVAVYVAGGRGAVLLLIATIVISDTGQYYAGRTFGRHALAPKLSPKKTIEGAIGGFVLAPIFLVFAAYYLFPAADYLTPGAMRPAALSMLGVGLVIAGIAGDLFESMLKRAAGVKDSSALIPGHGGVLDRIDALLFAAPVFYVYLRELVQ